MPRCPTQQTETPFDFQTHTAICLLTGIGMTIESDFYATEAGRQHFSDQLTSIRYVCASPIQRS